MSEFNPAEAARLIAEARDDDAQHMTERGAPFWTDGLAFTMRKREPMLADQLEAAAKEVARLTRALKHATYYDIPDDAVTMLTDRLESEAGGTPLDALACDAATNIRQLRAEVRRLQLVKPRMVRPDPAPEYTGPCVCSPESDCVYHDTLKRDAARKP